MNQNIQNILLHICCKEFDITLTELMSRSQKRNTVNARRIAAKIFRNKDLTVVQVGKILDRHYSSICILERSTSTILNHDVKLNEKYYRIMSSLQIYCFNK